MNPTLGSSFSLPLAQMVAKKDAACQTKCCGQVPTANGRAVDFAQPSESVCPDIGAENNITTGKSLSDYGVQFVSKTLRGSNMLFRSVAGFASHHAPVIGQGLMFLATMPAQAGAYPVSTSPAYNNGANAAGTPYTPSLAYPTTNLTTTSNPTPDSDDVHLILGFMFGAVPLTCVLMGVYGYCSGAYSSYKQLKRDNPHALNRHALQAALKDPWYAHGAEHRQACDRLVLPVPNQSPPEPATREKATQTICEKATQTEPVIDESEPQGYQPPTYAEAITFSVR